MGSIYSFGSQESLTQNIYLTQGVNETFSAFNCHASGVQIKFAQPDKFVRRMINKPCNSSQCNFKENFNAATISKEYQPLVCDAEVSTQYYLFHKQANTQQKLSLRDIGRAVQTSMEQPETQDCDRETKKKNTFLQRLLNFTTRFFISCINIKNKTVEEL